MDGIEKEILKRLADANSKPLNSSNFEDLVNDNGLILLSYMEKLKDEGFLTLERVMGNPDRSSRNMYPFLHVLLNHASYNAWVNKNKWSSKLLSAMVMKIGVIITSIITTIITFFVLEFLTWLIK